MSITEIPLAERYEAIAQAATTSKPGEILAQVQTLQDGVDKESKNEERAIHNAAVDVAFRDALIDVLATTDIDHSDFDQVWNLIDVANVLSDNRLCDIPLGYWLVEDLLDSQTIKGCRKVFEYLQSRREAMANKNFEQKQLSVLRCCNELLRRLSRAEDAVFCGRVFIYLFDCFPLGDRSSVNLRAEYHIDNITTFDVNPPGPTETLKPMDVDTQPPAQTSRAQTPVSMSETDSAVKPSRASPSPNAVPPPTLQDLYPSFWSLQNIFSAPPQLTDPETSQAALEQFKEGISKTLSYFRTVSNTTTSSSMSTEPRRGSKRKAAEMDMDESSIAASAFNPKYLTSRDLFELELHDIEFRRHVLVQTLILLDFLLSWTSSNKQKFDSVARNPAMIQKFVLSEADEKWVTSTRRDIEAYLGTGADGRHYLRMVNMVLARDKNWVLWKAQNCLSIKKNPVPIPQGIEAQESLKKISQEANSSLGTPAGASELAFLSDNVPLEALKHRAEDRPSVETYYKEIETADLDLDFANTDEEKREIEERKAGSLWRALRSAKGRRFSLCEQIKNGDNLQALINSQNDMTDNINGVGKPEAAHPSDAPGEGEKENDSMDNDTDAVVDAAQSISAQAAEL